MPSDPGFPLRKSYSESADEILKGGLIAWAEVEHRHKCEYRPHDYVDISAFSDDYLNRDI